MIEFYIELTNTRKGEPLYSWRDRFSVTAPDERQALARVETQTGLRFAFERETDTGTKHRARRAAVCAFVEVFDPDQHPEQLVVVLK